MWKYLVEALVLVIVEQTLRRVRPDYLPWAWILVLVVITTQVVWSKRTRVGSISKNWGKTKIMWSYAVVAVVGALWLCTYWFAAQHAYKLLLVVPPSQEGQMNGGYQDKAAKPEAASPTPGAHKPHQRDSALGSAPVLIPPGIKIEATTNAPNSAAIGINTGTVTVNPPANPNAATVTYDCVGNRRTSGASPNAALSVKLEVGAKQDVLKKMADLNDSRRYPELLSVCKEEMSSTPEWLTLYLFCGLAYLALQDGKNAKDMLDQYESRKGPAYDSEPCSRISEHLKTQLALKPPL